MSDNEEANKKVEDLDEFDLEDIDEAEGEAALDEDMFEREDKSDSKNVWIAPVIVMLLIIALLAGAGFVVANWLPKNQLTSMIPAFFSIANNTPTMIPNDLVQVQVTPVAPGESQGEVNPPQSQAPVQTKPATGRDYEATPVIAIGSPTAVAAGGKVQDVARTSTIAALLTQAATIMAPTQTEPASEPSTTAGADVPTVEITPANGSATAVNEPPTPVNGSVVPTVAVTPAATSLPQTGWADEVGAPFMLGIAVLLIFVIILTRWLRASRAA